MQLPYSEELNIGYLSRLFDNTTNCYKFFWFQAILHKLDSTHSRFTFNELINEMIADAWYMVTEYHLRLGPLGITDNLEEVVKYIYETYNFPSSEKREKIPEIIEADGKTCETEILSDTEYIEMIDAKLDEELAEYHKDQNLEELADLLEVIHAAAIARGYSIEELEELRAKKAEKRGGFKDRIFLKKVIE